MANSRRVKPDQTYQRLTVVKRLLGHKNHRRAVWLVECECGNRCTRTAAALLSGQTTQCSRCVRAAGEAARRRWSFPCTDNARRTAGLS